MQPGVNSLINWEKKDQVPVIDSNRCTRCGKCVTACPSKAIKMPGSSVCSKCIGYCITMDVPCNPNNYIFSYADCDACGICIAACQNNAIYWYTNKKIDIGIK